MEATKGRFLRPDEMMDKGLTDIGVKFIDRTTEAPCDVEYEAEEEALAETGGFLSGLKMPALFLALTIGIGVCEHLGLMADIIAVPGMCVCAACFGWNARWR